MERIEYRHSYQRLLYLTVMCLILAVIAAVFLWLHILP